ncbi:ATP-binding protein [Actinoallomurus acanthiterrae]
MGAPVADARTSADHDSERHPGRFANPRPWIRVERGTTRAAASNSHKEGGPVEVYPDGRELVWRRAFPGLAEHARPAREFVAFLLADLPALDDAVLVTGELIANALRHTASATPGGQFLIEVRRHSKDATIALTDQGSSKQPRVPTLDNLSECGRGLYIAKAAATKLTWAGSSAGRTFTAVFENKMR